MSRTVTIEIPVGTEFIDDVIDAAGYGIGYWAKSADSSDINEYVVAPQDEFVEQSTPEQPIHPRYMLTLTDIVTAMQLIVSGKIDVRADIIATVFKALREDYAGEIDSEIADVIIQVACFYDVFDRRAIVFG